MITLKLRTTLAVIVVVLVAAPLTSYHASAVVGPATSTEQAKLIPSDGVNGMNFGLGIAISGNTAVVGANGGGGSLVGSAYVYVRNGTSWSQQQKLTASDGVIGDFFGNSVAIDGDTIAVSATRANINAMNAVGAIYIFTRSGTVWTEQQKVTGSDAVTDDRLGSGVDVHADTLVATTRRQAGNTGAAYVFTRSGTTWSQQQKIIPADVVAGDEFGASVALDSNTIIVGASSQNTATGAAYIYLRTANTWGQQAKITGAQTIPGDRFGSGVGLSGERAIVGTGPGPQMAFVYARSGTTWTEQQELTGTDTTFGLQVDISGSRAAVSQTSCVCIIVYTYDGSTWREQQHFTTTNQGTFSAKVAIDGAYLMGSAPPNPVASGIGAAFVFDTLTPGARADTIGVYRRSNSIFYLRNTNNTGPADITALFGTANSLPVTGDWDGDGIDTIGVYDQPTGTFHLRNSNSGGAPDYAFVMGNPGDVPLAGRWDNTMTHDGVGVARPSNGLTYLKRALTSGFSDYAMILGSPGDLGVAGDWDGDGYDSPGVYRPYQGIFYLTNKVQNGIVFSDSTATFGAPYNYPIVGNWNGGNVSGIGAYSTSSGLYSLRNTPTSGTADKTFVFGNPNDIPVAGRWTAPQAPPPGTFTMPRNVIVVPGTQPIRTPEPGSPDNGALD